jgi:hypothetical protein
MHALYFGRVLRYVESRQPSDKYCSLWRVATGIAHALMKRVGFSWTLFILAAEHDESCASPFLLAMQVGKGKGMIVLHY